MRVLLLLATGSGCAFISDKHEQWRLDPDEDGTTIADDCDDNDASIGAPQAWYVDKDEDGFGDTDDVTYRCTQPDGHVATDGDCDDADAAVFPGADEACDGADNNCDGAIDEGLALSPWYADADQDGFGNPDDAIDSCGGYDGRVANADDCDDTDPAWQVRGEAEIPYNGIDDNCDAADGDGDRDLDGYWSASYHELVVASGGTPMDVDPDESGDCDDNDETIHPGATETWYDGIDSDCDGRNDCDLDGDGFEADEGICEPDEADCNDLVDDVNPGAEEQCATDVDDNCDGSLDAEDGLDCVIFYSDFDGDGYGTDDTRCGCGPSFPYQATVSGDCNDANATINPGASEEPYDGIDRDCGGEDDYDRDGDGFVPSAFVGETTAGVPGSGALPGGDCNDIDAAINPDATEDCATAGDDNCDELTNELDALGCTDYLADGDGDEYGVDGDAACWCEPVAPHTATDGGDCVDSDPAYHPGAEDPPYDGEDTDCGGDDDWDADDDGYTNADFDADYDAGTLGTFRFIDGELIPVPSAEDTRLGSGDCHDDESATHPDADELCDGEDNDCDGIVDNDAIDLGPIHWDGDGDGYGDPLVSIEACSAPGYVADDTDCDDSSSLIHPGAEDYCGDGVDADCSGDPDDDEGCTDIEPDEALAMVSCMGMGIAGPGADSMVNGEHISVAYGPNGNWSNTVEAAGLLVAPTAGGAETEAVYGGTVWDYAVIDGLPTGTGAYTMGHPTDSVGDLLCSAMVRVGDVVGAVHTTRIAWSMGFPGDEFCGPRCTEAHVDITKKELWNESGRAMVVEYTAAPGAAAGPMDLTIQRRIDFDIGAAPGSDGDTAFTREGAMVASSGTDFGVSVALGSCSPDGLVGATTAGVGSPTVDSGVCDPDGYSAAAPTILQVDLLGASGASPRSHRFVLAVGDAPLDAIDELDLEAAALCDTGGIDAADPAYPGGECLVGPGGGGSGGGGPGGGGGPEPGPGDPTE